MQSIPRKHHCGELKDSKLSTDDLQSRDFGKGKPNHVTGHTGTEWNSILILWEKDHVLSYD